MTTVLGPPPHDVLERSLLDEGFGKVAGVDEVGRGAWAGPVSVGIVVFCPQTPCPDGVRDSKEVAEEDREALYPLVCTWGLDWAVGHVGADDCDRFGMTAALRLASRRALAGLRSRPDVLLLDGPFDYISDPVAGGAKAARKAMCNPRDASEGPTVEVPELPLPVPRRARRPRRPPPVRTVVDGDATSISIAAASIVAKVTRDRLMREMAESFPAFDFDRNKGYPSPTHKTALAGHGLSSVHRRSWAFVDGMAFR
ncbi:MAG: ribonuclease HII [Acidimicrobiales bacterium]|nr:ribonuclease HII [Acidimicrobiales bacterium]